MRIPWITKYIEGLIAEQLYSEYRALSNHMARNVEMFVKHEAVHGALGSYIIAVEATTGRHDAMWDKRLTAAEADLADIRASHGNTLYKLNKTVKGLGKLYKVERQQHGRKNHTEEIRHD